MAVSKYIAAGFKDDAAEIIEAFIQENTTEFPVFAEKWRERNFVCIYRGRERFELNQFTGEIFQITLGYLDHASFLYQVGALYLLYCLFRSQLLEPKLRIRITLPHIKVLNDILTTVSTDTKYGTLLYVIDYLRKHAMDFVASGKLYGPCAPVERDRCAGLKADFVINESKKETSVLCGILEDLKNGFCDYERIIKELPESNIFLTQKDAGTLPSTYFQNLFDDLKKLDSHKGKAMIHGNRIVEELGESSYNFQNIGSRRSEIKATQYGRRALFRQLNPLEINETKTTKPKKRVFRRRPRKEDRRVGRPRKCKQLEQLLMEKLDDVTENKDDELVKTPAKRGPTVRCSYLDNYEQIPSTSSALKNIALYTGRLSDDSSD